MYPVTFLYRIDIVSVDSQSWKNEGGKNSVCYISNDTSGTKSTESVSNIILWLLPWFNVQEPNTYPFYFYFRLYLTLRLWFISAEPGAITVTASDVLQRAKWGIKKKGNEKYKDQYSSGPFPVPVEVTRRSLSPPPARCSVVPFNLSREVETFSCLLTSLPYQQVSRDGARGGRVSRREGRKSLESVILSVCFCLACSPTIGFQCGVLSGRFLVQNDRLFGRHFVAPL